MGIRQYGYIKLNKNGKLFLLYWHMHCCFDNTLYTTQLPNETRAKAPTLILGLWWHQTYYMKQYWHTASKILKWHIPVHFVGNVFDIINDHWKLIIFIMPTFCLLVTPQVVIKITFPSIAKPLRSTPIRYGSSTKVSDRCLIDVDSIWGGATRGGKVGIVTTFHLQRKKCVTHSSEGNFIRGNSVINHWK